jgi:cyclophilin family peptidyl-prolyl cis-trans isomerase
MCHNFYDLQCLWILYDRKYVAFGKLVQGDKVLKNIEDVGDEEGRPTVTVKIINCGEFIEGKKFIVNMCDNMCDFVAGPVLFGF